MINFRGRGQGRPQGRWTLARWLLAAGAVGVGLVVVLLTAALGSCSAFGGSCPGDPALEGDVFGGLALGFGLVLVPPVLAAWPTRAGVVRALGVALPLALLLAWLVGSAVSS